RGAAAGAAGLPAAWPREALSQAEAACARAPSDGYCLTALGMAQYRLGQDAEAVQTLTRAERLNARGRDGTAGLALLALAHHRLGHENEVRDLLARLPQPPQTSKGPDDEEARVLLYEVELRIRGKPPPWPGGEG